ncbi:cytochrome c biogenesis protein transmembrane region [Anaeromyxobacter sp. K]|uniref:cytochrome c biogenesis protein CcdA n=1 Tax=Anaeromyxobacter sp. (strain K) TaxID=447217 RepID=UPI00017BE285|nr:cytochrome c biogenesis protein CcdA [Anaeromyxobacter sp. K]ACG72964.1 cytochrome c biogenesis protein transmembrane region [Anaeromyxobacter sp. K]
MGFDLPGLFAAGILTFASPCVLPLVPVYLSLLGGASVDALRRGERPRGLVPSAIAFSLGLAAVFVALGAGASAAGEALSAHRDALLAVSGALVVALGLKVLGVLRLPALDVERRPWLARVRPGGSLAASLAFGGAFALGWTPCVGPVLGSVLTWTASAGASPARGALYLGTYAAGLVTPLVLAAAFAGRALAWLDRLKRQLPRLEKATGLLLVGAGILLATDRLMVLMPRAGGAAAEEVAAGAPAAPAVPSTPSVAAARPAESGEPAVCTDASSAACAVAVPDLPGAAPAAVAPRHGPALVEIVSRSCPVCRRMEPVVAAAERGCPGARVERHQVEAPEGAALARAHRVVAVPTFLALDGAGREVQRLVGEQSLDALVDALQRLSGRLCQAAPAAPRPAAG